jgi:LEA14-like dessication related protein
MNKFITYIAIGAGISIVAIMIFAFLGNGSFSRAVLKEDKI